MTNRRLVAPAEAWQDARVRQPSKLIPALIAAAALVGGVILAASTGPNTSDPLGGLPGFASYTPIAGCIEELPSSIDDPQFRPDSLRLPDGSEAIRTSPDPAPGLHIVVYRVPVGLDAFVDHVLDAWPRDGWVLGRGEREAGEAESVFYLADKSRYGQFRARSVFCDLEQTEVTLTLGEDVADARNTGDGRP